MTLYQLSQQLYADTIIIKDGRQFTTEALRDMYLSCVGAAPTLSKFSEIKDLLSTVKSLIYSADESLCYIGSEPERITVIVDKVNNCIYDFFTYTDTADFFKKLDTRQIENGVTFDENFDILRLTKGGAIIKL